MGKGEQKGNRESKKPTSVHLDRPSMMFAFRRMTAVAVCASQSLGADFAIG